MNTTTTGGWEEYVAIHIKNKSILELPDNNV